MGIILARIDSRLIHGQVAEGWLPSLRPDDVIVASSQYAQSGLARKMMRMSLPADYGLEIFNPPQAAEFLKRETPRKFFVLIESIGDLKEMLDLGLWLPRINIGNTRYEHGKKELSESVYITPQEDDFLRGLTAGGVKIDIRALPASITGRFC